MYKRQDCQYEFLSIASGLLPAVDADNDYCILCSSGVQKLLTDIVCHQQLNIHSVAFLCVNSVIYDLSKNFFEFCIIKTSFRVRINS